MIKHNCEDELYFCRVNDLTREDIGNKIYTYNVIGYNSTCLLTKWYKKCFK